MFSMYNTIPFRTQSFPNSNTFWKVISFGEITINPNIKSEPQIEVFVVPYRWAKLSNDLNSSGAFNHEMVTSFKIGIGQFTNLPLGSILKDKKNLIQIPNYTKKSITLNVDKNGLEIIKASSKHAIKEQSIGYFVEKYYKIPEGTENARFLLSQSAKDDDEENPISVIFPCYELLRYYWGTSSDIIKQIVCGGLEIGQNQLYNPDSSMCYLDENEVAYLRLRKNRLNDDALTIARIPYDKNVYIDTQNIYDSMICHANNGEGGFPLCYFPFQGETTLTVRGKKIKSGDKWFFLVYMIESCTGKYPFKLLKFDRDNNNGSDGEDNPNRPPAWKSAVTPPTKEDDQDDQEISDDEEPSRNVLQVSVSLPVRQFLHQPQKEEIEKIHSKYRSANNKNKIHDEGTNLSTGDGIQGESESGCLTVRHNGEDKQRKRRDIAPRNFASFFEVLKKLMDLDPENLSYKFLDISGKQDAEFNKVSFFPAFIGEKKIAWSYVQDISVRRRRVIIADIEFYHQHFYLIEAETRQANGISKECITTLLVYKPETMLDIREIRHICLKAAIHNGVWLNAWQWQDIYRKKYAHGWKIESFANSLLEYFNESIDFLQTKEINAPQFSKNIFKAKAS